MLAMLHRRRTIMLLAGLLPALASLVPVPVRANDRDLRASPVPVAACVEVYRSTYNNPWTSGGYFSVSSANQILGLRCPVPLNQVDLSGTTNDNDISKFRVHYADTDGFGEAASVAVALVRVAIPSAGGWPETTIVCSWSSNVDGTGATTGAKATKACAHDLAAEAFYHFDATLRTNSNGSAHSATFLGITFP